jgi:uncharacterized protein YndB with AHSA1/START domain
MQKDSVIMERVYSASPDRAWKALTEINQMRQWYFPMLEDFRPEVGFETRFTVENEGKEYVHIWKITEVLPMHKISYEWKFGGFPGNSLLTFELLAEGKGTRLILTHKGVDSFRGDIYPGLARENFVSGWTSFLDQALMEFLKRKI